ncbi:TGD2 [Auxenochlorella protothecoides x Auxenochlorella symbiontica]
MQLLSTRPPGAASFLPCGAGSGVCNGQWFRPVLPGLAPSTRLRRCRPLPASTRASASMDPASLEPPRKQGFLSALLQPLRDFGLGATSLRQATNGLFVIAGISMAFMLASWAKGNNMGRRGQSYQAILEFPVACGISVGTPVRIRGVPVGGVLGVQPSLEKVEVLVEIRDSTTVIPRNSLIEANQSGLIAEPLIDITPQLPLPEYKGNPLDDSCEEEGKVVCHQGRIRGERGVAMDDLVYICTKIARQMDAAGLDRMFSAVDAAQVALEGAEPLLQRAMALTEQIIPLLEELRQGGLLGNVEALTSVAAEAAADIQRLQVEVLTDGNVRALREAVQTLTKTLAHIERIAGEFGTLSGDKRVVANLKQFIEALSRLVAD